MRVSGLDKSRLGQSKTISPRSKVRTRSRRICRKMQWVLFFTSTGPLPVTLHRRFQPDSCIGGLHIHSNRVTRWIMAMTKYNKPLINSVISTTLLSGVDSIRQADTNTCWHVSLYIYCSNTVKPVNSGTPANSGIIFCPTRFRHSHVLLYNRIKICYCIIFYF